MSFSKKINFQIISLLVLFIGLSACGNHQPFDSTIWQQGNPRSRGTMAEDLVQGKMLVGKSPLEIEKLLGRPDGNYPNVQVYKIDMGLPFKDPAHYGFHVYFNSDNKVREAKIVD